MLLIAGCDATCPEPEWPHKSPADFVSSAVNHHGTSVELRRWCMDEASADCVRWVLEPTLGVLVAWTDSEDCLVSEERVYLTSLEAHCRVGCLVKDDAYERLVVSCGVEGTRGCEARWPSMTRGFQRLVLRAPSRATLQVRVPVCARLGSAGPEQQWFP